MLIQDDLDAGAKLSLPIDNQMGLKSYEMKLVAPEDYSERNHGVHVDAKMKMLQETPIIPCWIYISANSFGVIVCELDLSS